MSLSDLTPPDHPARLPGMIRGTAISVMTLTVGMSQVAIGDEVVSPSVVGRFARWFSPEFRRIENRLDEVDAELARLPSLKDAPFASRYGFRSGNLLDPEKPEWLQFDLERRQRIDRIVVMPAFIPTLGERGVGYGFPKRFRIEISDDPQMRRSTVVVDRTTADVPNPGRFPEDFRIEPTMGRYVRMTSTRHFPVEDGFIWALEELLVLSGNRSVAVWTPVESSSSFDRFPNWSHLRSQDGQSTLGMPVSIEPSPSKGYLSGPGENRNERKWLQIDFATEHEIDQIRLLPVEREGFEMIETGAFPRGYHLELARDPDFREVVWDFARPTTNLIGYPGDCAVTLQVPGVRARHLRLKTLDLWADRGEYGYGLAEIQAYAGGENVALGRPVAVSDRAATGRGWSPEFVNDGFNSRHALLELPEYLDLILKRRLLTEERARLADGRDTRLEDTRLILGYGGGTMAGLAVAGCGWLLVRQRRVRRRAVIRLREQIARDLHDDIGSNLGGIVLLSEVGSRQSHEPGARQDFLTIKEAAEQTAEAMQDIVWLIEGGNTSLRLLISRMRQTAELILGETDLHFDVRPPDFRDGQLSLFFRRHFFFAYKEALHNVRRHADARSVHIRIDIDRSHLEFEVRDDGRGFDPEKLSPDGHGLANLSRRARRLAGDCEIETLPGAGTRVRFRGRIRHPRS